MGVRWTESEKLAGRAAGMTERQIRDAERKGFAPRYHRRSDGTVSVSLRDEGTSNRGGGGGGSGHHHDKDVRRGKDSGMKQVGIGKHGERLGDDSDPNDDSDLDSEDVVVSRGKDGKKFVRRNWDRGQRDYGKKHLGLNNKDIEYYEKTGKTLGDLLKKKSGDDSSGSDDSSISSGSDDSSISSGSDDSSISDYHSKKTPKEKEHDRKFKQSLKDIKRRGAELRKYNAWAAKENRERAKLGMKPLPYKRWKDEPKDKSDASSESSEASVETTAKITRLYREITARRAANAAQEEENKKKAIENVKRIHESGGDSKSEENKKFTNGYHIDKDFILRDGKGRRVDEDGNPITIRQAREEATVRKIIAAGKQEAQKKAEQDAKAERDRKVAEELSRKSLEKAAREAAERKASERAAEEKAAREAEAKAVKELAAKRQREREKSEREAAATKAALKRIADEKEAREKSSSNDDNLFSKKNFAKIKREEADAAAEEARQARREAKKAKRDLRKLEKNNERETKKESKDARRKAKSEDPDVAAENAKLEQAGREAMKRMGLGGAFLQEGEEGGSGTEGVGGGLNKGAGKGKGKGSKLGGSTLGEEGGKGDGEGGVVGGRGIDPNGSKDGTGTGTGGRGVGGSFGKGTGTGTGGSGGRGGSGGGDGTGTGEGTGSGRGNGKGNGKGFSLYDREWETTVSPETAKAYREALQRPDNKPFVNRPEVNNSLLDALDQAVANNTVPVPPANVSTDTNTTTKDPNEKKEKKSFLQKVISAFGGLGGGLLGFGWPHININRQRSNVTIVPPVIPTPPVRPTPPPRPTMPPGVTPIPEWVDPRKQEDTPNPFDIKFPRFHTNYDMDHMSLFDRWKNNQGGGSNGFDYAKFLKRLRNTGGGGDGGGGGGSNIFDYLKGANEANSAPAGMSNMKYTAPGVEYGGALLMRGRTSAIPPRLGGSFRRRY